MIVLDTRLHLHKLDRWMFVGLEMIQNLRVVQRQLFGDPEGNVELTVILAL